MSDVSERPELHPLIRVIYDTDSREVLQFLQANLDLHTETGDGTAHIRVVHNPADHRELELAIVVDSDTSIRELGDLWPLILEWRKRLAARQGSDPGPMGRLKDNLADLHVSRGFSYRRIADTLNYLVSILLLVSQVMTDEPDRACQRWGVLPGNVPPIPPSADTDDEDGEIDWDDWDRESTWARGTAREYMLVLGMDIDAINNWISHGLSNARRGAIPFAPDTPIARDVVRERLRYWARTRAHPWATIGPRRQILGLWDGIMQFDGRRLLERIAPVAPKSLPDVAEVVRGKHDAFVRWLLQFPNDHPDNNSGVGKIL